MPASKNIEIIILFLILKYVKGKTENANMQINSKGKSQLRYLQSNCISNDFKCMNEKFKKLFQSQKVAYFNSEYLRIYEILQCFWQMPYSPFVFNPLHYLLSLRNYNLMFKIVTTIGSVYFHIIACCRVFAGWHLGAN